MVEDISVDFIKGNRAVTIVVKALLEVLELGLHLTLNARRWVLTVQETIEDQPQTITQQATAAAAAVRR